MQEEEAESPSEICWCHRSTVGLLWREILEGSSLPYYEMRFRDSLGKILPDVRAPVAGRGGGGDVVAGVARAPPTLRPAAG